MYDTIHKVPIRILYIFLILLNTQQKTSAIEQTANRSPHENYLIQQTNGENEQITIIPKDMHITGNLTVDGEIITPGSASIYVKKTGDTMTGALVMENSTLVQFNDATNTKSVAIAAPTSVTTSYDLNLPQNQGAPYTALTDDGSGNLLWLDPAQRVGSISYGLTGFINQTDSTISFDNSSRTFTIEPTAPLTQYIVYNKGTTFIKTEPESFQIADQEGMHYIYFDGTTGQLFETFTFAGFDLGPTVAYLYWSVEDQTANIFCEERHACHRDIAWHTWAHNTIGLAYGNGLELSGYTANVDSLAAIEIGISNGALYDEDIEIKIINSLTPTSHFEQPIAYPAQIPVFYRMGSSDNWHRDPIGLCPYKNDGPNTKVQYNLFEDSLWKQAVVDDGFYVAYFIFATNNIEYPIIAIQGRRQDATLFEAMNNSTYQNLQTTTSLPFNEMHLLYRIILRADSTYTNPYKATIAIVNDIRAVSTNAIITGTALSHAALIQRNQENSHPATAIAVDSASFVGALNTTDDNVQTALATIDSRLNQNLNTTNAPTFAGLIATGPILADNAINTSGPAGSLHIGTANTSNIHIGDSNSPHVTDNIYIGTVDTTVYIPGTTVQPIIINPEIVGQYINLNITEEPQHIVPTNNSGVRIFDGINPSGAQITTSNDSTSWILNIPTTLSSGSMTLAPGAAGFTIQGGATHFTINQGSHDPITLGTANGLTLNGPSTPHQVLSLGLASTATTGALSSIDWNIFNNKQPSSPTLNGLSGFDSNGIMVQTAPHTFSSRTIIGTLNQVQVANGDGVFNNPTLSLPQNIDTAASPTFANLIISGTSGAVSLTNQNQVRLGELSINGPAYVALQGPAHMSSSYSLSFPATDGVAGERLTTDGNGNLYWDAKQIKHDPVTIGTSNGLSIGGLGGQVLSLDLSTATTNGALSSTDWSTFNNKQDSSTALNALANYNTNGLLTQTAPNTFTGRTITGTTNQVIVVNGDGVSGDPTLSLPQNIATTSSPTFTGMTLTSFNGVVKATSGTLNASAITNTDIATNAAIDRSKIASNSANHVVINNALGNLSSEATLAISRGGTNSGTALNNNRIMISSGDAIVEAPALTNGQLLIGSTGTTPVATTITGTANQVIVTTAPGSITLSLPQNINTTADTTFGSIAATNNTNQISLGTTNTITINAPPPSTSHIYTLPDAGSNASFILSAGPQTINGTITLPSLTASLPLKLNASKNIISSTLTNSDIALNAAIDYSKINLTNSITNTDIATNAAIARSKIATNTANHIVINDTSGALTSIGLADGQILVGSTNNPPVATTITGNNITVTPGAGSLSIAIPQSVTTSATPTFASETLSATSNQLTLGATNTTTINATAPTSSRTYTIPDSGVNSSFVMTDGTQTINGNKTLSGTTKLSGLTASLPLQLDASNNIISSTISLSSGINGILPVINGGTNSSAALVGNRLMISSASAIGEAAALTDGQLFIGSTGNAPTASTISGTNITVTPGAGSLDLSIPQSVATTANPTFTGMIVNNSAPNIPGQIHFLEGSTNGANYIALQAPTNIPSNVTITLPTNTPADNYYLKTDSSGNTSWASVDTGTINPGNLGNLAIYSTNPNGTVVDDSVTINGKTASITIAEPSTTGRIYTVPDSGASSSFVMSESAQTINGTKTITNVINTDGGIDRSTNNILAIGETNTTTIKLGRTSQSVQFNGDIILPSSTGSPSSAGVVYTDGAKTDTNRFISNPNGTNTFVGKTSGTLSATGGSNNVAFGYNSGTSLTSGSENTFLGSQTGTNILTGNRNIFIGHNTGSSYTLADYNNIAIGCDVIGSAGEINTIRLGADQTNLYLPNTLTINTQSTAQTLTFGSNINHLQWATSPTTNNDLTNKSYVDGVSAGIVRVDPVLAIATANITPLSGPITIDNVSLVAGNRVLLTGQTNLLPNPGSENGIWVVQAGAWTRPTDYPSGGNAGATYTLITSGDINGGTSWAVKQTIAQAPIIDTDTTTWVISSVPSNYSVVNEGAGTGLIFDTSSTGQQFNLRSLTAGSNMSIVTDPNPAGTITIALSATPSVTNITTSGSIFANGSIIDRSTGGTLSIGGANVTTLNLGKSGQTVDILGNTSIAGTATISSLNSAGIVHTNTNGDLSTSQIINSDIAALAAIDRTKIAIGTANNIIINDATGALSSIGLTNGQLVIGSTGNAPTAATITQGSANQVIVTNGAGSITLSLPQDIHTAATPTFAHETLSATSNQLTLGTTNTTTINATAPSSSRTYTIPETGTNSSFVMTDSSAGQTITGGVTLSGTTNLSGLAASLPLQLDGSKNIISSAISLSSGVSGTLPIAHGGTNSSTALVGNRLMISSASAIGEAAALTDGQLFIGSTGNAPTAATITQGSANQVIVTNGAGSITLSLPQDIHTTATPTFAHETLSATSNQLTLGTTNTTTINATAPTSSRTYTIPETGTNSSFVMTDSSAGQTITGGVTLSGTTNLSGLTASLPLQLDGSKNIISSAISLSSGVSGTLPIASGGTNSSTALVGNRLMISSASAIGEAAALTDGQLFIGSTGNAPTAATITQGSANQVIVTNGAGSITLSLPQDIHTAAAPTFAHETLSAISNQLTLGTTNTTTINATAPTSSRTYTIPDSGANSSFVMTDGTQTINGNKTFSSSITLSSFATAGTVMNNASGTLSTTTLTNGQLLIGSTGNIPVAASLTGTNITITSGSGTLAISIPQSVATSATPTFASQTLSATTNQLTLGTTNTTTINATAPTSPRTYTIPDSGADSSFVMTDSNQTINGNKTFTGTTVLDGTTTLSTLTTAGAVMNNANGTISTQALTNGQLLIGSTGNIPVAASMTGTNITITPGAGTLALSIPQSVATSATPTFASQTLSATTNQLTLGTTNTTTINATAPTSPRTYSIPDSGTNSSFVMTDGNQTINGNKTLTGTTVATNSITLNATNELRFADSDSSNYVALKAAGTVASNITWTLPSTDGTLDQALVTNGSGTMSWKTITPPGVETRDYLPRPTGIFTYTAVSTNAPATFAGGVYTLTSDVTFSKVVFRTANITGGGQPSLYFYQTPDGTASSSTRPATRIGGITNSAAVNPNNTNAITIDGGTPITLKAGIVYVLWGLASGTSVQVRCYTGGTFDVLTANLFAGTYPTTFTTAISAATTPATFDGSTQATTSTGNLVPIIRLINF